MTDEKIRQLIKETVDAALLQFQNAGLLRSSNMTAYEKTEALLRQYPRLKGMQEPYAQRVAQSVESCLAEVAQEPYADVIRLFYFENLKNAACAKTLCCDERTCRRNRKKLVEQFSARLASPEFIRELLEQ